MLQTFRASWLQWSWDSSGEPITIVLLNGHGINYLLTTYIYSQLLVLLSASIREASVDSAL